MGDEVERNKAGSLFNQLNAGTNPNVSIDEQVAQYEEDLTLIAAALRQVERETWEKAAKLADNEPELDGPIPASVRIALEQYSLEEQQRLAVRTTKRCIADKCRQQAKEVTP